MIKWFIDQSRSDVGIRLVKLVRVGCWKNNGWYVKGFHRSCGWSGLYPFGSSSNRRQSELYCFTYWLKICAESSEVWTSPVKKSESCNKTDRNCKTAGKNCCGPWSTRIRIILSDPGLYNYNNSEKFSKKIVKIKDFWSCKLWPKLFLLTF